MENECVDQGITRQIDIGSFESNAAGLEVSAAQRAPGVESDDQPGRTQQRTARVGLTELDLLEERFRAVPAPAHREAGEAYLESGLPADQLLERRAVLRHACRGGLVRDQPHRAECKRTAEHEQRGA